MAMQTGIATSKVIILVLGAGVAGPIVLGKSSLSDFITNIQEALFKGEKGEATGHGYDNAAIQAQIMRLGQEVRQLYGGRQITVVNGSNQNSNFTSYIVPLAVVGAAGYCYMWWKGWSFSDIMYVTKKNMANAVSGFTKQMEQVSAAVAAAKKHLTQRMEKLNEKLDEQKEVTGAIKFEVGEVRENLAQMGMDIESVQRLVQGLGTQIDTIEGKQDLTNAGVVYLCHFVQGLAGAQKPELLQVCWASVEQGKHAKSMWSKESMPCKEHVEHALHRSMHVTFWNKAKAGSRRKKKKTHMVATRRRAAAAVRADVAVPRGQPTKSAHPLSTVSHACALQKAKKERVKVMLYLLSVIKACAF